VVHHIFRLEKVAHGDDEVECHWVTRCQTLHFLCVHITTRSKSDLQLLKSKSLALVLNFLSA